MEEQQPRKASAAVKVARNNMERVATDSDILTEFEMKALSGDYKEYYKTKRNNFFASIQNFDALWRCFQVLDSAWRREFDDLERIHDVNQMLPVLLFMIGHAKFRVALELGFASCLGEAQLVLRSAIESVVLACKFIREPGLVRTWLDKDKGTKEWKAFLNAFERNKKESLFPARHGLHKLHKHYSQFSEWGTHTTVLALAQKFTSRRTDKDAQWGIRYTGVEPKFLALSLFNMLNASALMEEAFYRSFEDRLKFDHVLADMRRQLVEAAGQVKAGFITKFRLSRPPVWRN